MKEGQEKLLVRQDRITIGTIRQRKETAIMRKDLSKASQVSQQEHRKTRERIIKSNSKVIDVLVSKVDSLQLTISKTAVAARMSNREIWFVGEHRASVLTPLLLIRDQLRRAILQVLSHQVERVSPQDLYWLQSEYENLVSSAMQEVAALSYGSTATSFDKWSYSERAAGSLAMGLQPDNLVLSKGCKFREEGKTHTGDLRGKARRKRLYKAHESFSFNFPFGRLLLAVPRSHDSSDGSGIPEEVSFSFVPCADICTIAIAARFVKMIERGAGPRLHAQLNAFKLVQYDDQHIDLIVGGKIEDVDAAFRSGTISPYDMMQDGRIACLYVSSTLRRFAHLTVLVFRC